MAAGGVGDPTRPGSDGEAEGGLEGVVDGLLGLYYRINDEVVEGRLGLPADLEVLEEPMANVGPEAPLGQWSPGFSRGMGRIDGMWDECLPWAPEATFPDFAYWVVQLSMFAGREYGEGLVGALEPERGSLEEWAGPALERFEEHMAALAEFGGLTAEALAEFDAEAEDREAPESLEEPRPARREKVGRNEPCPCGSGRKYKKRCLGAGFGAPR